MRAGRRRSCGTFCPAPFGALPAESRKVQNDALLRIGTCHSINLSAADGAAGCCERSPLSLFPLLSPLPLSLSSLTSCCLSRTLHAPLLPSFLSARSPYNPGGLSIPNRASRTRAACVTWRAGETRRDFFCFSAKLCRRCFGRVLRPRRRLGTYYVILLTREFAKRIKSIIIAKQTRTQCLCTRVYVCVCACIYIYTHKHNMYEIQISRKRVGRNFS